MHLYVQVRIRIHVWLSLFAHINDTGGKLPPVKYLVLVLRKLIIEIYVITEDTVKMLAISFSGEDETILNDYAEVYILNI
jgi:hypothetical protein